MVILKNKGRVVRTYNLPHAQFCGPDRCACSLVEHPQTVVGDAGQAGVRMVQRRVCSSLTIMGGAESAPLPDAVTNCPDVRADLDQHVLAVVQQKPVEAARSEADPPGPSKRTKGADK